MTMTNPIACMADIESLETTPLSDFLGVDNTHALITEAAEKHPDNIALRFLPCGDDIEARVEISYREFLRSINCAANLFQTIDSGSPVISYLLPNLPQTHYVLWAAECVGVVNPINWMLEASVIRDILNEANTTILVVPAPSMNPDLWSKIALIADSVASLKCILCVEDANAPTDGSTLSLGRRGIPVLNFDSEMQKQSPNLTHIRAPGLSDTASYFHTGGTTGKPKLAVHSHRNEVANARMFSTMACLNERSNVFVGLPLFHVNAVIATGLSVFAVGGTVTLMSAQGYRNPKVLASFWQLVDRYRATHFSSVPTVLTMLMESSSDGFDTSSLEFAICGAAPLSKALFSDFEARFPVRILEGYGLTEGTCVSSLNPPAGERRVGSIGVRLPHQSMKTVALDASGHYLRDCKTGEAGVIVVRGPNVISGYLEQEANQGVFIDENWFVTGDLAREDEDGYFWLVGRAKDLIIRGGHNIDPKTIESAMIAHEAVADAAAVGQPDAYAGELPCVYVTLRSGASVSESQLLNHAREMIGERAAIPAHIEILEALPVTGVGKIFKPRLRELAAQRVIEAALLSGGIDAKLRVTTDKNRGLLVTVETEAPSSEVYSAIGGFAVEVDCLTAGTDF
ncbi:MAG: acyl-CoA synthetase [Pseudomonadota bacterium]|nr:acyl-CoA synthetase [Pseudomonadota bacterium]